MELIVLITGCIWSNRLQLFGSDAVFNPGDGYWDGITFLFLEVFKS
jgi:hypothetical protein